MRLVVYLIDSRGGGCYLFRFIALSLSLSRLDWAQWFIDFLPDYDNDWIDCFKWALAFSSIQVIIEPNLIMNFYAFKYVYKVLAILKR